MALRIQVGELIRWKMIGQVIYRWLMGVELHLILSGWRSGTFSIFPFSWECHHPN